MTSDTAERARFLAPDRRPRPAGGLDELERARAAATQPPTAAGSGGDLFDEDLPLSGSNRVVVPVQEAEADDSVDAIAGSEVEDMDQEVGEGESKVENCGTLIR